MSNLRSRLISVYFLVKNQNQSMQHRFGLNKNLVSLALFPMQFIFAVTMLFLKTFGMALDKLQLTFASNRSMIQSIEGTMPPKGVTARVFVLFAKNCAFNSLDIDFIRSASTESEHFSIILNCDCGKYEIHRIESFPAHLLIVRQNLGYDFGAYRDAYKTLFPSSPKIITFINNSIIFLPDFNNWLTGYEVKFRNSGMPIGGIIESKYPKPHFQSYLFSINLQALNPQIDQWIKQIKNVNRKTAVVNYYEVGLSRFCREEGISVFTLYSAEFLYFFAAKNWLDVLGTFSNSPVYEQIRSDIQFGLSVNPTHGLWRFLVHLGCPIIKKDLILKNPGKIPDIYEGTLSQYRKYL